METEKREYTVDEQLGILARRHGSYAEKYEGGQGLAVGGEGVEYRWREGAIYCFAAALRAGSTPDEAEEIAKKEAREYIKKHNARRPKDINWKRWDGSVDNVIEDAKRIALKG